MKKLLGVVAAGAAVAGSLAIMGTDAANADPGLDVTGQPYGTAVQILKASGYKVSFGGSFGSDLPQAQCVVDNMKSSGGGSVQLHLDCTEPKGLAAEPEAPTGPTRGANGVTTVIPRVISGPPAPVP